MKKRKFLAFFTALIVIATIFITTSTVMQPVSAAPTVGTNVDVTNNVYGQDEPNIAVNPLHSRLQPLEFPFSVETELHRVWKSCLGIR